jgi:hypothetical protein
VTFERFFLENSARTRPDLDRHRLHIGGTAAGSGGGRRPAIVAPGAAVSMTALKRGEEKYVDEEREGSASGIGAIGGARVERETTPAPANVETLDALADDAEWAEKDAPSARPTSVPDYDVAAVAFETSLRHQALPSLPHDVAVPTRTRLTPPADLGVSASFLLLHVDGVATVRDIAELAALPVTEVLATLLDLTARGLVQLGGTQLAGGTPVSGARRKSDR